MSAFQQGAQRSKNSITSFLSIIFLLHFLYFLLGAAPPFTLGWKRHGIDSVELCDIADVHELGAALSEIMSSCAEYGVASVCECLSPDQLRLGFAHVAVLTGARNADSALFFGGAVVACRFG